MPNLKSIFFLVLISLVMSTFADDLPDKVEFNKHIRPIFSSTCFNCHGPDKHEAKAGLQLHTFEAATQARTYKNKKGKSKTREAVIVPGKPEESLVWELVNEQDEDLIMPPSDFHIKLTDREKKLIKRWIAQGAKYQKHWAYEDVPNKKFTDKPARVIDDLIEKQLKKEKLKTRRQSADKQTLIRRLSLDLRGYTSSQKEVEAYLNDKSANAWEKLIDKFLASHSYGERMAVHWLDLVRFADSAGIHGDQVWNIYPYRDQVIKSFNDNKRFDQFTREQLAGDLLPNPSQDQLILSGYNRLNMVTKEGGAQPGEYLAKYASDRVRNVSAVWMGSTLGCAECHDHKYDPFTAKDFYQMSAFFADIKQLGVYNIDFNGKGVGNNSYFPPELYLLKKTDEQKIAELRKQVTEIESKKRYVVDAKTWEVAQPLKAESENGTSLRVLSDKSILASGAKPSKDTYHLRFKPEGNFKTLKLDILRHKSFKGLSRANGNVVLTKVYLHRYVKGKKSTLRLSKAMADYSQAGYPVGTVILGAQKGYGWAVGGHKIDEDRRLYLMLKSEEKLVAGAEYELELIFNSRWKQQHIGRCRISTNKSLPVIYDIEKKIGSLEGKISKINGRNTKTLVTETVLPRVTRIFPRGNWMDTNGEIVAPRVPHFMSQINKKGRATRLDLANWLCSEKNPMASRAFMNRLWQMYFGTGLSQAVEDFGSQGELPVNTELLDFLAAEFMNSGWDIKKMVKLIVLSKTYQLKTESSSELREKDPYNRFLARQSILRLSAEFIRDNALKISGLLVDKVGGRSVKPYQPKGYYQSMNHPRRVYKTDKGDNQYRRGLYTHWQRTFLHPFLKNFDAPSREEASCARSVSNTPLQALTLLNDPTFVEAARILAVRIIKEGGTGVDAKLNWTFKEVLGRDIHNDEAKLLKSFYENQLSYYQKNPKEAIELAQNGQSKTDNKVDKVKLATWSALSRALMNLHEFIVRK